MLRALLPGVREWLVQGFHWARDRTAERWRGTLVGLLFAGFSALVAIPVIGPETMDGVIGTILVTATGFVVGALATLACFWALYPAGAWKPLARLERMRRIFVEAIDDHKSGTLGVAGDPNWLPRFQRLASAALAPRSAEALMRIANSAPQIGSREIGGARVMDELGTFVLHMEPDDLCPRFNPKHASWKRWDE